MESHLPLIVREQRDPVALLLERMPEVQCHIDENDVDLPYIVFGFLAEYLEQLDISDPLVDRAFDVFNELADARDPELQNLLQVSVFEQFACNKNLSRRAVDRLSKEALPIFRAAQKTVGRLE